MRFKFEQAPFALSLFGLCALSPTYEAQVAPYTPESVTSALYDDTTGTQQTKTATGYGSSIESYLYRMIVYLLVRRKTLHARRY